MVVNDEFGRIRKETVVFLFKVLSQHFPGGTEETSENLRHDSQFAGRESNLGLVEYEEER
jgi:hypothetical protein